VFYIALSGFSRTQKIPFSDLAAPKHPLQEMQVALRRSPACQRAIKPGSRMRGRLSAM
jgi:hypothetical protein